MGAQIRCTASCRTLSLTPQPESCDRLKRETERIKREIEAREMEEALALVKASKGGKAVKFKVRCNTRAC